MGCAKVSLSGTIIGGATFGGSGSINETSLSSVTSTVPATTNNTLVEAKNAVQQIKDAGVSLNALMTEERPDQTAVYNSLTTAFQTADVQTIQNTYSGLSQRISSFLLPATQGNWNLNGQSGSSVNIFNLTMGDGYQAVLDPITGMLDVTADPALNASGKITVQYDASVDTYTLVATMSSTSWTLTETALNDPTLKYQVIIPLAIFNNINLLGANPTLTGSMLFIDSILPSTVTFNGTVTASGNYPNYSQITFTGSLNGPGIVASGDFVANFPSSLPANAPSGAKTEQYPTSFSMTNAKIAVTSGTTSASISGAISATAQIFQKNGQPESLPTAFQLSGGTLTAKANGETVTITGNMDGTATYTSVTANEKMMTASFSLTNAGITLNTGTTQLSLTGSISAFGQRISDTGNNQFMPTYLQITGNYSDSATTKAISGTITGKWNNPSSTVQPDTAQGTLSIVGSLTETGYQDIKVNLQFTANGSGTVSGAINQLNFGATQITGSASAQLAVNGKISGATLTLTNQANVIMTLTKGATGSGTTGTIDVGSTPEATIARDPVTGDPRITFIDHTTELLPL